MIRKRCHRHDEPGHAHGLTFSCYRRLSLLSKDRTRRWLIEAIDEARSLAHFDLWAYVIMPEHVHILIVPSIPFDRDFADSLADQAAGGSKGHCLPGVNLASLADQADRGRPGRNSGTTFLAGRGRL